MNDENMAYVSVNRKRNHVEADNPSTEKFEVVLPPIKRPPLKRPPLITKNINTITTVSSRTSARRSSIGVDSHKQSQLNVIDLDKETVDPTPQSTAPVWSLEQYCNFLKSNTTDELFNNLKLHVIDKVAKDDTPELIVAKVAAYLHDSIRQTSGEAYTECKVSTVSTAPDDDLTPVVDIAPPAATKARRRRRTADQEILEAGLLRRAEGGTPSPPSFGAQTRRSKRLRKSLCLYRDKGQVNSISDSQSESLSKSRLESCVEWRLKSQLESCPELYTESHLPSQFEDHLTNESESLLKAEGTPESDGAVESQVVTQSTSEPTVPSQSKTTHNPDQQPSLATEDMKPSPASSDSIPEDLVALYTNQDKTLPAQKPLTTIFEERTRAEKYSNLLRSFQFTEGYYYYPTSKKITHRRKLIRKYGLHNTTKNKSSVGGTLDQMLAKLDEACLSEDSNI